jgi:two-component system, NtrC family, sensor histidine kinase HydH
MNRSNPVRVALPAALIPGISLLHYLTPHHRPVLHDIFQLLYCIPIIFAAFRFLSIQRHTLISRME